MDPTAVVFEISSDEELGWDDHGSKGISDISDDHNWIAELLNEVNREGFKEDDDSDEVVVVGEVLPSNPRKRKLKSSPLVDLDDDCVILDSNPDKPVEVRNSNPNNGDEDDDSDDLLVVSEKGQVACRDYPHPRHLCIKFPFSSTPNQSHCEQCYCYVCDSLAPCVYWGTGSSSTDHCHATDKDEFWVHERKVSKNGGKDVQSVPKVVNTSLSNQLPPINLVSPSSALVQPMYMAQNQVPRPSSACARSVPANIRVPSIINQNRSPNFIPRDKYQPDLVAQQLIRANTGSNPRDLGRYSYNPGTRLHRPVFSRIGSAGVAPMGNHCPYRPWRDNYGSRHPPSSRNPSRRRDYRVGGRLSGSNTYLGPSQPNAMNTPGSFPSQIYTPPTANTLHAQREISHHSNPNLFDFSPNFQSQVNSDPFLENPVIPQPHLVTLSSQSQVASSQPTYTVPSQIQEVTSRPNYPVRSPTGVDSQPTSSSSFCPNVSQKEIQAQCPAIDPSFFDYDISWSRNEANQQTTMENWYQNEANQHTTMENFQLEGSATAKGPSLYTSPRDLVDYQCEDWIYNNQPVEPGSLGSPGSFGLHELSPEPALIDKGTLFGF